MSEIKIPISVNFKSIKDASEATDHLKDKLTGLGSMDVPIHARMDTGSVIAQQNRILIREIDRVFKQNPIGGTWSQGPGGKTYTSPNGTKYGMRDPAQEEAASAGGGGSLANTIRKAMWGGLALAGVGGVMSQMFRGMEVYKQTAIAEGQLQMRGGRPGRRTSWGYGPLDVSQQDLQMAEMLGGDKNTTKLGDMARMASRSMGMSSPETVMSYMADYYRKTGEGKDVKKSTEILGRIFDLQKKTSSFVSAETFISDSKRVLGAIGSAVGNVQIAGGAGFAQSLLASMYGVKGIGMAAPGMLEKVNRGLASGGNDIGSQSLSWAALGGFSGPMSADKWYELNKMKESGLKGTKYVTSMRDLINKIGGNNGTFKKNLWRKQLGLTFSEAEQWDSYVNSEGYQKAQQENLSFEAGVSKYGTADMKRVAQKAMSTEGGAQLQTEAMKQMKELDVGKSIKPSIDKFSNAVNTFVSHLINGGFAEMPKALKEMVGTMGPVGKGLGALVTLLAVDKLATKAGGYGKIGDLLRKGGGAVAAGGGGALVAAALAAGLGVLSGGQAIMDVSKGGTGKNFLNDWLEGIGFKPGEWLVDGRVKTIEENKKQREKVSANSAGSTDAIAANTSATVNKMDMLATVLLMNKTRLAESVA